MKDIDILKREAQMCDDIWEENWKEEKAKGNEYANLNHMHVCDFELCNFRYCKNRKELNKLVEKKCKEYLSSIGEERDEDLNCCDYCIHDRYVTISVDNPGLILNMATLGLDKNNKWIRKGIEKLK